MAVQSCGQYYKTIVNYDFSYTANWDVPYDRPYDRKTLVVHATVQLPKCQEPTLVKLVVGFQTNGRFLAKYTIEN